LALALVEQGLGRSVALAVARYLVVFLKRPGGQRLLSETRLPVKWVSTRCGFGSEETMRRSFLRLLAATPQDYRARFSA